MRLVQLLLGLFLVICCASSAATQSVNANPPYYITECSCKAGFRKSNCSLPTAAGEGLSHVLLAIHVSQLSAVISVVICMNGSILACT